MSGHCGALQLSPPPGPGSVAAASTALGNSVFVSVITFNKISDACLENRDSSVGTMAAVIAQITAQKRELKKSRK